jgi:DNA repair protein RadC
MKQREGKIGEAAHYHSSISGWPEQDRPREKLLRNEASALSDAELIAILLRTGTGSKEGRATALDIAQALLRQHGSLLALAAKGPGDFSSLHGVGAAKAAGLAAAFELGRRIASATPEACLTIRAPADVVRSFQPLMRDLNVEVFKVLLLDSANHLMKDVEVSRGILNSSLAHPREVFRPAITQSAASVILLHNHPSGNPDPSAEDVQITKQMVEAGRIIGIPVHDHIIIGRPGYSSLAEKGLI